MGLRLRLLKCIGKAVAKHGVRFVMNLVPGGDVVYDIAADTWEEYQRDGQHGELLAEVEALAQAAPAELRSAVYETVEEAARDQAADVREAMTNYPVLPLGGGLWSGLVFGAPFSCYESPNEK